MEGVSKTVDGVKVLDNVSFSGEQGGQDRLRGRERAGADHPVQDPHGRAGAGRGQRQVGRHHHRQLSSPRTTPPTLTGLRPEPGGLAAPVFRQDEDDVYLAGLPWADAVLRRGCVQAGEGPLRRRKGALYALPDDALRLRTCCCWTSPPTIWIMESIHGGEQGSGWPSRAWCCWPPTTTSC